MEASFDVLILPRKLMEASFNVFIFPRDNNGGILWCFNFPYGELMVASFDVLILPREN